MELVFLGTSAAIPTVRRNVTSVYVQMTHESLLVDAGEGTQMQILRAGVRRGRIDRILVTHLHGDHFFGLIGLLNSYQLGKREEPLQILGPPGLESYVGFMKRLCQTEFTYPLTITELPGISTPTTVLETPDYTVTAAPLKHRLYTLGYRIRERDRPGRFDADKADALGVPFGPERGALTRGESITLADGRLLEAAEVVGESRPGRSITVCTDTARCEMSVELARGSEVLVHEATFEQGDRVHARRTQHSTSGDAARVARDAGVGHLFLTHISSRYMADTSPLMRGVKEIFAASTLSRDFMRVELPLDPGPLKIGDCRSNEAPASSSVGGKAPQPGTETSNPA
ncbi:MAG: ribonuclease Z [Candidatus Delongbacteria bacterium]|nr:ribonuclease Z [Candidatus Delongbacteria bacterium]